MPSKIPPLSVRLGAERLAKVDAYAAEAGLSRHAAVLALVDRGLSPLGPPQAPRAVAPKARPAPKAVAVKSAAKPKVALSLPAGAKLRDVR